MGKTIMMIAGIADLIVIVLVCVVLYDLGEQKNLNPFVDLNLLAGKANVLPEDKSMTIEDLPGIVFPSNTLLIAYQRAESRIEYLTFACYIPTNGHISLQSFNLFYEDRCDGHPSKVSKRDIKLDKKYYFGNIFAVAGSGERTVPSFRMKDVKTYRQHAKRLQGELSLFVEAIETNHGTYICGKRLLF